MKKRGRPHHPDVLTPRQWEVLALIRENLSNREIAEKLGISLNGVKFHVSEVLTKLGVPTRLEAARWRRPKPGGWRLGAIAPLVFWRKLNWFAPSVAGGLGIAIAAGFGLLIWGLLVTQSNGPVTGDVILGSQEGQVLDSTSVADGFGLWLFDTATESAARLPVDERIMLAQWLEDGTTFVAYATDEQVWRTYDIEGNVLGTFLSSDGPGITAHVHPTSDGTALLVQYSLLDDKRMAIIDVATLLERPFESLQGVNFNVTFSPDGSHLAYTNKNGDLTSAVVANPDGSNAATIRVVSEPDEYIFPVAWSPDGAGLLVQLGLLGTSCGLGCQAFATQSFEVLDLSGEVVWKFDANRLTDVQWAGTDRLFVGQRSVTVRGEALDLSARYFDTLGGGVTAAPLDLAETCCASLSPDGQRAVIRKDTGDSNPQCMLVEAASGQPLASISRFSDPEDAALCASVSWTSDSTKALVSSGGN